MKSGVGPFNQISFVSPMGGALKVVLPDTPRQQASHKHITFCSLFTHKESVEPSGFRGFSLIALSFKACFCLPLSLFPRVQ